MKTIQPFYDPNCACGGACTTETSTPTMNPIVTIEMESGDLIKFELYPEKAPNTVKNFIELIQSGSYDGTIFHRVIPGFMIQGGDPQGTGMGGPGWCIKGEFSNNGFPNDISHKRGAVSMARAQNPDSGGCQFFIVVSDATFLDGEYATFGMVLEEESMAIADKIVSVPRNGQDRPNENQVMKKVSVDTFGMVYGPSEKL